MHAMELDIYFLDHHKSPSSLQVPPRQPPNRLVLLHPRPSQAASLDLTFLARRLNSVLIRRKKLVMRTYMVLICRSCHRTGPTPFLRDRNFMEFRLTPTQTVQKRDRYLPEQENVCIPRRTRTCCLRRFKMDFRRVGWSNWIVAPQSFWTNYCKGLCSSKLTSLIR